MSIQVSPELEAAMSDCIQFAKAHKHEIVTVEHLLQSLLDTPSAKKTLESVKVDLSIMKKELGEYLSLHIPTSQDGEDPQTASGFKRVIQHAIFQVNGSGKKEVTVNEVLVAMFAEKDSHAVYLLRNQGVSRLDVVNFLAHGIARDSSGAQEQAETTEENSDESGGKANPLDAFTTNLNKRAGDGKIDPLVGRDNEVERVIQTLVRRRKNNPLLVGEAGVGKTAIAEGLAKRIVDGDVPEILKNCEIYSLDIGSLVAGTKYRGDFEQRIKAVIEKLKADPKKILFVDEIHTLIGAGAASGGNMDASNLLKPALSNGELRCIGATTYEEYRQIFEKEHALARRFQKVDVNEPSVEDAIKILTGLKGRYEEHHGVKYTQEALEAAATLSDRFITDRRLPDKAIDVLDEAGARQRTLPASKAKKTITQREIEEIVAKMARIPSLTVSQTDKERLRSLESDLSSSVFGQDQAAQMLAKSVKRNRSGLARKNKPVGSFLFAGPTGVGKTEMTKQLAKTLGLELIRFDMSEYMEKHSVSRLIGAPPGYVGFEGGGQLTEAVNKNPHCVLLLDEIEKAHPDVFNILLQVMDNASLTDNNGRKADFRNVVVIMTSNVGASAAAERKVVGFTSVAGSEQTSDREKALKDRFAPEFRNRLDGIIQFNALNSDVIMKVVDKLIGQLDAELRDREYPVSAVFSDELRNYLAKTGFDPAMGARPMERLVQETIRDALADELLFGGLEFGGEVEMDVETDEAGKQKVVHQITKSSPQPGKVTKPAKKKNASL